jgi:hypothetical protein
MALVTNAALPADDTLPPWLTHSRQA